MTPFFIYFTLSTHHTAIAPILVCKTCLIWFSAIYPPILSSAVENYISIVIQKHNQNPPRWPLSDKNFLKAIRYVLLVF